MRRNLNASSPTYHPSSSRSRFRGRTLLTMLSVLSKNSIVVASDSSSTGYNVYNYDLTTPQFTPDGLLKQVEYACAAPRNSMPMIIVPIALPSSTTSPTTDEEDNSHQQQNTVETEYALIIATISSPTKLPDDNSSDPPNNNNSINTSKRNANGGRRGQSRIIEIPIPSSITTNTSGGSNSVIIGLNGILSDSVSLLQTARQSVQSHQSRYGNHRGASRLRGMVAVVVVVVIRYR